MLEGPPLSQQAAPPPLQQQSGQVPLPPSGPASTSQPPGQGQSNSSYGPMSNSSNSNGGGIVAYSSDYADATPQQMGQQMSSSSSSSNQRPLEDFSRQLKEVAPNVQVAPTGYHHQQGMYPPEHQQMVSRILPFICCFFFNFSKIFFTMKSIDYSWILLAYR